MLENTPLFLTIAISPVISNSSMHIYSIIKNLYVGIEQLLSVIVKSDKSVQYSGDLAIKILINNIPSYLR